jgi:hypothetical protein
MYAVVRRWNPQPESRSTIHCGSCKAMLDIAES